MGIGGVQAGHRLEGISLMRRNIVFALPLLVVFGLGTALGQKGGAPPPPPPPPVAAPGPPHYPIAGILDLAFSVNRTTIVEGYCHYEYDIDLAFYRYPPNVRVIAQNKYYDGTAVVAVRPILGNRGVTVETRRDSPAAPLTGADRCPRANGTFTVFAVDAQVSYR